MGGEGQNRKCRQHSPPIDAEGSHWKRVRRLAMLCLLGVRWAEMWERQWASASVGREKKLQICAWLEGASYGWWRVRRGGSCANPY